MKKWVLTGLLCSMLCGGVPAAAAVADYANALEMSAYQLQQQPTVYDYLDDKTLQTTINAIYTGLGEYSIHEYTGRLNEREKKIARLLNVDIPAILNKTQKSISEVQDELLSAYFSTSVLVIQNQNTYPQPDLYAAAVLFTLTAYAQHAEAAPQVKPRVKEIMRKQTERDLLMQSLVQLLQKRK